MYASNWNLSEPFDIYYGNINSLKFSPDGSRLAIGGQFGEAKILNASTGKQLVNLIKNYYDIYDMNFSPDGTKLAVTGMDQTVWIYDAFTGKTLLKQKIGGWGNSVAFSPDGTSLAIACADNTARILDASNGVEITRMQHDDDVYSVAFSLDGTKLATGSKDGTARVWYLKAEDLICETCSRVKNLSTQPAQRLNEECTRQSGLLQWLQVIFHYQ